MLTSFNQAGIEMSKYMTSLAESGEEFNVKIVMMDFTLEVRLKNKKARTVTHCVSHVFATGNCFLWIWY